MNRVVLTTSDLKAVNFLNSYLDEARIRISRPFNWDKPFVIKNKKYALLYYQNINKLKLAASFYLNKRKHNFIPPIPVFPNHKILFTLDHKDILEELNLFFTIADLPYSASINIPLSVPISLSDYHPFVIRDHRFGRFRYFKTINGLRTTSLRIIDKRDIPKYFLPV